jgi:ribonucleoside-triphosphate reductase
MEGKCPCCGSENVEHITRVTGFFSKVSSWNKGKIGELKDRQARDGSHFGTVYKVKEEA